MDKRPKISIVVPIHDMEGGDKFLWKLVNSLTYQTFQDFELIITKEGLMAENTNAGIKKARGELIKILYLDDHLAHPHVLEDIVDIMDGDTFQGNEWMIIGADDNNTPKWTEDIETGNNKLGSPSALVIRNKDPLLFDERMSWMLDCDYYRRMYDKYGKPLILPGVHVVIGKGDHQVTNLLTNAEKSAEVSLIKQKYE
jgi:glycosyltransferase involved in cell wall biosynthesis